MEETKRKLYLGLALMILAVITVGVICFVIGGNDTKIDNNGTLVLLEGPSVWH